MAVRLTKQERWIVGALLALLAVNVALKLWGPSPPLAEDVPLQPADSVFLAETQLVDSLIRAGNNYSDQGQQVQAMVRARQDMRINVNTASAEQLQRLPGIGPVMAKRIIAHREKNGYFTGIDDLQKVRGIGPVTASKIEPYIIFEP